MEIKAEAIAFNGARHQFITRRTGRNHAVSHKGSFLQPFFTDIMTKFRLVIHGDFAACATTVRPLAGAFHLHQFQAGDAGKHKARIAIHIAVTPQKTGVVIGELLFDFLSEFQFSGPDNSARTSEICTT